jgi:DNA-binding IclR family transcriptional regulator
MAYDMHEHTKGISAIGMAFRDWTGDLHSISVPVPTTRFAEKRTEVEKALGETRRHV